MTHCSPKTPALTADTANIALVGNPNVGKSVLFHRLTGKYVVVSNYPGTTIEITQGILRGLDGVTLVDTPGIVSFPPHSEDEAVTERVVLGDDIGAVLQVGDAKNLRRTLHLTVQLAEMGRPLALGLNMMDEAQARGLTLDARAIEKALGVPVTATVATRGHGMDDLVDAVRRARIPNLRLEYPRAVETALEEIAPLMPAAPVTQRALGLLWLSGSTLDEDWFEQRISAENLAKLRIAREKAGLTLANTAETPQRQAQDVNPVEALSAAIQQTREDFVSRVTEQALRQTGDGKAGWGVKLGHLSTHPVWGLPILALALYGMYWFVGVFGAGTLVGLLEKDLFGGIINPWLTGQLTRLIPIPLISDFLVGEYGMWTVGVTYAAALLLPIVFTFFITFSILEDSGYLPRLAVLTNRLFTRIGLNGQAVLPMVLGLGCVTMATMTTRVLSRPRERILVTLLLALAIPCSAQLGVVMGMLAGVSLSAGLIWGGVVLLVLLLVGWLAARLMPGERAPLVVELPPLRMPVFSNVLVKTAARMEWYIKEAVPLFLLGTGLLFTLDKLNVLPWIINGLEPVVTGWLGLPAETATAFLLGLLRRDFAATNLFQMQQHGQLTDLQVLVSITTITLFIPCIASMFMLVKERGLKMGLGMIAFIFPFAILVGGLLYRLLSALGWGLG